MRIYIAGPMRGLEDMNRAAFDRLAAKLRADGHVVINPAECFNGKPSRDLRGVLSCEAVVVLGGWQMSKGARLEVEAAVEIGMPVYYGRGLKPYDTVAKNFLWE